MKSNKLPQANIVIIDGTAKREIALSPGDRLLIGRSESSLRLMRRGAEPEGMSGRTHVYCSLSADVSEQHVEVQVLADGTVVFRDQRSTNGTMMRVPAHQDVVLQPDGEVLLGRSLMVRLRTPLWETVDDPGSHGSPADFAKYIEARLHEYDIKAAIIAATPALPAESRRLPGWRMQLPLPAYSAYLVVTGNKPTANLELERWVRLQVLLFNSGSPCIPIHKHDRVEWQFTAVSAGRQRALRAARCVASTDGLVIVLGKTGVGKDVLANDIHNHSARASGTFRAVNCATIAASLAESYLFGSVLGGFSGAQNRPGAFEQADGGTLFLDEIGELPLELQAKLLRVLEDGKVRRVGDVVDRPVNVRVLAATHRDLPEMVAQGKFRQDLWYRLEGVQIHLPDLRKEDILAIVPKFYQEGLRAESRSPLCEDEAERLGLLAVQEKWEGNARQLRNAMRRYLVYQDAALSVEENWQIAMSSNRAEADPPDSPPELDFAKDSPSDDTELPEDVFLAIKKLEKLLTLHTARSVLFINRRYGANTRLGARLGMTGTGAQDKVRRLLELDGKQQVEPAAIEQHIQEARGELQRFAGALRRILQL